MTDMLAAAYLLMPHGLKGAIKAKVNLANPHLLEGKTLATSREGLTLTVARMQPASQNRHTLTLTGITSREQAEELRGVTLLLNREEIPPAPEGEVYYMDLVGRPILKPDGTPAGTVKAVLDSPAHPLLEMDTGALVPAHQEFVEDLAATPLTLTEMGLAVVTLE